MMGHLRDFLTVVFFIRSFLKIKLKVKIINFLTKLLIKTEYDKVKVEIYKEKYIKRIFLSIK